MDRRKFLKILGVTSVALVLPLSIQKLVDHVVKGNYNEDLLKQLFGDILNKVTPEEFKWLDNLNETYYLYQINGDVTVTKNPKAKYFRDKLEAFNGKFLESTTNIFEASIKEYQYDKQLGKVHNGQPYFWPRVRSHRAILDRPTNKKWQRSRGQRHDINSLKVQSYVGTKAGNARWGNLRIENIKPYKLFNSLGEAAKHCKITVEGVSGVVNGKNRQISPRGSKLAYFFEKVV